MTLASTPPPPIKTPGPRAGGGARSLRDVLDDPAFSKPIPWDWRPFTARGRLTLLYAPPKVGKTTLAAHYAAAKSQGRSFLETELARGPVIWVGPDEHLADQSQRFKSLDANLDDLFVWDGSPPTIEQVAEAVLEVGADVVVLDTLPRVAQIPDENDNAAWTRWSNHALPLIHESDAAWVALHHARKGGGKDGEGIRGASTIFGSVEIAVSMQKVLEHGQCRSLVIEGTRFESRDPLTCELQPSGVYAVTSGIDRHYKSRSDAILKAILKSASGKVAEIAKLSGVAESTLRRHLDTLVKDGVVERSGEGGQEDPPRYHVLKKEAGNED